MTKAKENSAPAMKYGKYLAIKNLPLSDWLSVPMTDAELKAMINTMILVWEKAEKKIRESD